MRANDVTLSKVLRDAIQYEVPIYQRRYEWRKEQLQTFWGDLIKTLHIFESGSENEQNLYKHFFGSIVVQEIDVIGGIQRCEIIDGQQRITTICLFVNAIIQEYLSYLESSGGGKQADFVKSSYELIYSGSHHGDDAKLKIIPSKLDLEDFTRILCRREAPNSTADSCIQDAFVFFCKEFKKWFFAFDDKHKENKCLALLQTLEYRFSVAMITLDKSSKSDHYQVFESLNAKGTELTEADKLRNFCFMYQDSLPEANIDAFHREHWSVMEKRMKAPKGHIGAKKVLEKFMVYWTSMITGKQFRDKDLYSLTRTLIFRSLKSKGHEFGRNHETALAVQNHFINMASYAAAYRALMWPKANPCLSAQPKIVEKLNALSDVLGLKKSAHPLLMYILKLYLENDVNNDESIATCLSTIESYILRRRICGYGTKSQKGIFAKIAGDVYRSNIQDLAKLNGFIEKQFLDFADDSNDRWPDNREFTIKFLNHDFMSTMKGAKLAKFILLKIEENCCGNAVSDHESLSINDIVADFSSDGPEMNKDTIGNLILVRNDNTPKKGHPPTDAPLKMKIQSNIDPDNWDSIAVHERNHTLLKLAVELWPHPSSADYELVQPLEQTSSDELTSTERRLVEIEENQTGMDYKTLFGEYLDGAKEIVVVEPYIEYRYQFDNFLNFCSLAYPKKGHVHIELVTKTPQMTGFPLESELQGLQKDFAKNSIVFEFKFDDKIHDREIRIDDRWRIHLGRGLHIFQKPDKPKGLESQVQKARKCRENKIHYYELPTAEKQ